jgi:hypothetical protein
MNQLEYFKSLHTSNLERTPLKVDTFDRIRIDENGHLLIDASDQLQINRYVPNNRGSKRQRESMNLKDSDSIVDQCFVGINQQAFAESLEPVHAKNKRKRI